MLDAFYVNDQPELQFLSESKSAKPITSMTVGKKNLNFTVSNEVTGQKMNDARKDAYLRNKSQGVSTEAVVVGGGAAIGTEGDQVTKGSQNDQLHSYSTNQIFAKRVTTQGSSDKVSPLKKSNEVISNQNISSYQHYGSSYSHHRYENEALLEQLQNQRMILRFRTSARKEQHLNEAKDLKMDLLKKVYRLPFESRPLNGISQSVMRSIS